MNKHTNQLAIILIMIYCGCSGPSKKDPKLLEAFEIHKESVQIAAEAVKLWEKLPAGDTMRSKFDTKLKDWGENIVEVPGYHYHHEGLGHHHGRPPLNLAPDDMLLVQKELKDSIQALHLRILKYEEGQRQ